MTDFSVSDPYKYHHGLNSHFEQASLLPPFKTTSI